MRLLVTTQIVDKNDPLLGFFHRWIIEFAKHFDHINIICLKEGKHDLPENVKVFSLGKESGENKIKYVLRFYTYFWKLYIKEDVDYVFFHMGAVYNIIAAPFFLVRKFKHTEFLWWKTHGHINIVGKIALCFVDRVYTAVAQSFPVTSKKRHIVGHAVDVDLFKPGVESSNKDTLLFVGRISRSKRIEQVLEMASLLRKQAIPVKTHIIGHVVDSAYKKELLIKVRELNLTNTVEFVDGVSQADLVNEYQTSNILINPSDNDGLDKVVLEAMLCGAIPVTANRSFEELLSPHGLYMKKGDIEGYVECVKRIFSMLDSERRELSDSLRAIVRADHSINTITNRIFDI